MTEEKNPENRPIPEYGWASSLELVDSINTKVKLLCFHIGFWGRVL